MRPWPLERAPTDNHLCTCLWLTNRIRRAGSIDLSELGHVVQGEDGGEVFVSGDFHDHDTWVSDLSVNALHNGSPHPHSVDETPRIYLPMIGWVKAGDSCAFELYPVHHTA